MQGHRTARYAAVEQPFPGLRPFDVKDAFLFFGRDRHTNELLERLARNRFLAVVGTSGSGKSSLVRAGLMPALYRGYLLGATTRWKIAVMRPGSGPLDEMAKAITSKEALGGDSTGVREVVGSSSLGLVSAVRNAGLAAGESLLLVVDQFEELFRFASESRSVESSGEALLFVSSLLEAVDQFEAPIYVILTMRTDFLGDCTLFPGLPEAMNRSQYLIPRLMRDQRRDSIERPVEIADAEITPRLVQQILNDMGDDPDQLPVMQHAVARMYRQWKAKKIDAPLDLQDYAEAGAIAAALNDHAQAIYDSFDVAGKEWTRKLFRTLTKMDKGREVRRPGRLDRIFRVVGAETDADRAAVMKVVETFASEENSLLFISPGERPEHRVVDISHESLIRKWKLLGTWVKEEVESSEWFLDLLRDVRRQAKGDADYWNEPHLGIALRRREKDGWTAAWAEQYGGAEPPGFEGVQRFLAISQSRWKKRKWNRRLTWGGVAVLLLGGLVTAEKIHDANVAAAEARADARPGEFAALASAQQAMTELDNLRNLRDADTKKVQDLKSNLQSATSDSEKLKYQTQINTVNAKIVESLQKENKELATALTAAKVAAGQLPPGTAEDPKLRAKVEQLEKNLDTQAQMYEKRLAAAALTQKQAQMAQQPLEQKAPEPQAGQQQAAAPQQASTRLEKAIPITVVSDTLMRSEDTGLLMIGDFHAINAFPFVNLYLIAGPTHSGGAAQVSMQQASKDSAAFLRPFTGDSKAAKTVLERLKYVACDGRPQEVLGYAVSCVRLADGIKAQRTSVDGSDGRKYQAVIRQVNVPTSTDKKVVLDILPR